MDPISSSIGPHSQSTLILPRPAVSPQPAHSAVIDTLVDELIARWAKNDRVCAEELLNRRPELWNAPELAVELIYEEMCLRKERGEDDFAAQALKRFPQWRRQLQVMFECHRLLEAQEPNFPAVGEIVVGYRLLKRLGSGAGGQVFLAEQESLADRPVVIKLTSFGAQEHLHLARLQHTHIVPIYAVHDDPTRNLRVLCMPYLGGVTLEQLLRQLQSCPPHERDTASMVRFLGVSDSTACGPAALMLTQCSYVEALCWIASRLADALQYALEIGLVHLDVKPANILIAADGQPMLLDFHLARSPLRRGELPEGLGGTPPYMAPEQADGLATLARGEPMPADVDHRADIFALGAVLYESLAGTPPSQTPVPLCSINPQVSRGLSDIVTKCLAANPQHRFANPAALANDLRRHLQDLPLQATPNRSWVESYRKWRKRRPAALRSLLLMTLIGAALTTLAWLAWLHRIHDRKSTEHIVEMEQALRSAEHVRGLEQRRQTLHELHATAEQLRGLLDLQHLSHVQKIALGKHCQEFWEQREQLRHWSEFTQSQEAVDDLLEIVLLGLDLQVNTADDQKTAVAQAIETLATAEIFFGPSAAMSEWKARLCGNVAPERKFEQMSLADCLALGRMALQHGDVQSAEIPLQRAVLLHPCGYWPNFYHGQCTYRLGRYDEAAAAFSVCIGAMPERATAYFNRALAYAHMKKNVLAVGDYSAALRIDPTLGKAAFNRGLLLLEAKRYAEAQADLQRALHLGENKEAIEGTLKSLRIAAAARDQ